MDYVLTIDVPNHDMTDGPSRTSYTSTGDQGATLRKDTVKANVTAQFPLREVLGDVEPDFGRKFGHDREALRRYSSVGHWQVCRPSTTRADG